MQALGVESADVFHDGELELGVPCVINTRVGTSLLVTGERVRVDGATGLVERLASG